MCVDFMKLKIFTTIITLIFICSTLIVDANDKKTDFSIKSSNDNDFREIKVAMLSEEILGPTEKFLFVRALDGYTWTVGNKTFRFEVKEIYYKDIMNGELNTDNYDILLVPGGVGVEASMVKGMFSFTPRVKKWKNYIADFIKDGGGYTGHCGGASLITESAKEPESPVEALHDRSSLDVSAVNFWYESACAPLLGEFLGHSPSRVGLFNYMYCMYQPDIEVEDVADFDMCLIHDGVPMDIPVNTSHPIFDDYLKDTRRIKWNAGPAFVTPETADRPLSIVARYPIEEVSENESTKIYVWDYAGGIRGLLKGLIKSIKDGEGLMGAYYRAEDWELTNEVININFSNKPCMTAEIYPNENKGRIFLQSLHPEHPVWWGGHIEEMEDTNDNCMSEGLYKWVNMTPLEETIQDEETYNWWMLRREVAWVAKIPDNDLPPVYGPSQVCDFEENIESEVFTITGNSELSEGSISIDLYFRYSGDNSNWSEWALFSTDSDGSDGWSWEFNSPNGSGFYQFYSLRNVDYEGYLETEKTPPGPDAFVYVDID